MKKETGWQSEIAKDIEWLHGYYICFFWKIVWARNRMFFRIKWVRRAMKERYLGCAAGAVALDPSAIGSSSVFCNDC